MKSKIILIGGIICALLAAGLFWYYLMPRQTAAPAVSNQDQKNQLPAAGETKTPEGLGAQVYEKVENPVKDEVPQTNPFKEEYKNPFQ